MKISRYGAAKYHGVKSITFEKLRWSWSRSNGCVTTKQTKVTDFSTKSNHNYIVTLTFDDVENLLCTLSDAAVSEPALFEQGLASSLRSLIRLQAVVAGTVS